MSQISIPDAVIGTAYTTPNNGRAVIVDRGTDNLERNLRMPLLLFSDDDADTLVYIKPAPQQVAEEMGAQSYRWSHSRSSEMLPIPHRIHSRSLLDTKSEVLKDLFQPRNQARFRKRFGLTQKLPPGIKYVIDLTPPSEGDEAVIFMTELSCPKGVRKWVTSLSQWTLPAICVGGQDEIDWLPASKSDSQENIDKNDPTHNKISYEKTKNEDEAGKSSNEINMEIKQAKSRVNFPPRKTMNWQGVLPTLRADLQPSSSNTELDKDEIEPSTDDAVQKKPQVQSGAKIPPEKWGDVFFSPTLPLEYSPTRHRTGLERILHALEGLDPNLDTATKLWTFFALAKLLQVAAYPAIGDRILAWLYQGNNALFIEFNPELAYQMACGLQNRDLCQDSFAILVGEEALLVLQSSLQGTVPKRSHCTLHGRYREPLDDTEVQRVEYASKKFLDRILNEFIKLAGTEMLWVESIVKKNIRGRLEWERHNEPVEKIVDFCKRYVRSEIYQFLIQLFSQNPAFQFQTNVNTGYPGVNYYTAPARMPVLCQLLTRTFWKRLRSIALVDDFLEWEHSSLKDLAPNLPCMQGQEKATIKLVTSTEVDKSISEFLSRVNTMTFGRQEWSSIYFDFMSFQLGVEEYLGRLSESMINGPCFDQTEGQTRLPGVELTIVDNLVCLGGQELKFLPLWAGGNDDGTGGVFDEHTVPLMNDGGFSTAGPSIHLTNDIPDGDSYSMSSFNTINPDDAASTIELASHKATESHVTTTMSVNTSDSEFELIDSLMDMHMEGHEAVAEDDFDIDMTDTTNHAVTDDEDFDFEYDDGDDTDIICTISDWEDA